MEKMKTKNCDGEGHLSVLYIRGGTIPQHEQELVFSCQSQHAASQAGHTSTSDNPPHLIRLIFPEKRSHIPCVKACFFYDLLALKQ